MALVLALMAISFLVAITVQLSSSVNVQMQGASNIGNSIQLDARNRSGLNLIRAALAVDFAENKYDSEHDSWKKMAEEGAPSLFGKGNLKIDIEDLSGLLQVNALVPVVEKKADFKKLQDKQIAIWKRLLDSGKFAIEDDAEAEELIDALIDWIDADDTERDHGAEGGYYLSKSPPYEIRNAPLIYQEELLLIRGMTKELFYGNKEYLALGKFLTVAGRSGKININTAPPELLIALGENISEESANDMVAFRQEEDKEDSNVLADLQWPKQVDGSINYETDIATVQSQYFKVSVTAKHNQWSRNSVGTLSRDPETGVQDLVYWEVK